MAFGLRVLLFRNDRIDFISGGALLNASICPSHSCTFTPRAFSRVNTSTAATISGMILASCDIPALMLSRISASAGAALLRPLNTLRLVSSVDSTSLDNAGESPYAIYSKAFWTRRAPSCDIKPPLSINELC